MIILGSNAYHGDVAAVLLRDGELVAAVEAERFRRIKHWAGFPRDAISTCLNIAKVAAAEIADFVISRDPCANLWRKALFALRTCPGAKLVLDRLKNRRKVRDVAGAISQTLGLTREHVENRMHWLEHHPAHLARAFYASPFDEAAICAIDWFGDFVSTSWAVGRDRRLDVVKRAYFAHSLGLVYLALTRYLGFPKYHKVRIELRRHMPTGPLNRVVDKLLARKLLGWEPRVKFMGGLHKTIDWYFATRDLEHVAAELERRRTGR